MVVFAIVFALVMVFLVMPGIESIDPYVSGIYCGGGIIIVTAIVWIVGKLFGLSKGTDFGSSKIPHQDKSYDDLTYEERVEIGTANNNQVGQTMFGAAFILIVLAFIVSYLLK